MSFSGNEEDIKKRTEYIFKAAAQGNGDALYRLAPSYENPDFNFIGIERNVELAKKLFHAAATVGNDKAGFVLEVETLLYGTLGVRKDFRAGIAQATKLADNEEKDSKSHKRAKEYLAALMRMPAEALTESNPDITKEDLIYLSSIGWNGNKADKIEDEGEPFTD